MSPRTLVVACVGALLGLLFALCIITRTERAALEERYEHVCFAAKEAALSQAEVIKVAGPAWNAERETSTAMLVSILRGCVRHSTDIDAIWHRAAAKPHLDEALMLREMALAVEKGGTL